VVVVVVVGVVVVVHVHDGRGYDHDHDHDHEDDHEDEEEGRCRGRYWGCRDLEPVSIVFYAEATAGSAPLVHGAPQDPYVS
jgi:hypothetical protein